MWWNGVDLRAETLKAFGWVGFSGTGIGAALKVGNVAVGLGTTAAP